MSAPAPGTPAFWVSGWLGPQQYLSYNNLRAEAEPCGAWVWENQVSWYWEKETTDLKNKQKLFLEALSVLAKGGDGLGSGLQDLGRGGRGILNPGAEGQGAPGPCSPVCGYPRFLHPAGPAGL